MNIKLEAQVRSKGKKSDLNSLRKDGFIPAIIYGEGNEGMMITLEKREFTKEYKKTFGHLAFFEINVDDKIIKVILKDKQIHPVSREILHIDFQELHSGKPISLKVPFRFIGTAPGTKAGGVLEILHRDLEILCLPKHIPDDIEVDVSKMNVGDVIHLNDIVLENMEAKMPNDTALVTIYMPRLKDESAEEEETEPEIES
jgi:large subunit ribosomal protein L25